jgi:hypothetical protein
VDGGRGHIAQHLIDMDRPAVVTASVWTMVPIGFLGAYFVAWTLAEAGRDWLDVAWAGLATLLINFALMRGVARGWLLGWFGAITWSCLGAGLPALSLGKQIQRGLPLADAFGLAPFQSTLVVLSCILMALLFWPSSRSWIFESHRLRTMRPCDFDRYLNDLSDPNGSSSLQSPSVTP